MLASFARKRRGSRCAAAAAAADAAAAAAVGIKHRLRSMSVVMATELCQSKEPALQMVVLFELRLRNRWEFPVH